MTMPPLDTEQRRLYEQLLNTRGGASAGGESPWLAQMAIRMVNTEREAKHKTATLREIAVSSVGYVGALEALDLRRRLMNGGLLKLIDFFPGTKAYLLATLMVLAGIGGCAACIVRYANGVQDPWIEWGGAFFMLQQGLSQISNRLAQDRAAAAQIHATAAVAVVAAASNPEMPETTAQANAAMAKITEAVQATSTPVPEAK
jgi:hypothetical protein